MLTRGRDQRFEQTGPNPASPPCLYHAHGQLGCGGVHEAVSRVTLGQQAEPGGTHGPLIVQGDDAEVSGARPVRDVVRELRLVQSFCDAAARLVRSPEGRCNEHLGEEVGIGRFSRANGDRHEIIVTGGRSFTGAGVLGFSGDSLAIVNAWSASDAGCFVLPSGRLVRGRSLRHPVTQGLDPDFGLYLLNEQPQPVTWDARWVRWPDFRLPRNRGDAQDALYEAWRRATAERVEVACGGGRGRTGTALACIAVLDGVPAREAVAYVRKRYDPRAVETPWQRRYVACFTAS